jgi:periplasmic protein TonB
LPDSDSAARAAVARAKPAPRKKAEVTPLPTGRDEVPSTSSSRPKPRVARVSVAPLTPKVAAPTGSSTITRTPRRASAARPKVVLLPSSGGVAMQAPVWVPELAFGDRGYRLFRYTLGISIAIHMVVLAIKFQPFDLRDMLDRGPPLEIALVNAKSATKPTKADILAQAHLDGGGNTNADRRAKTPLPVLPKDSANTEIAETSRKAQFLEQQAKELMTQLKSTAAAPAVPKTTEAIDPSDLPTATEMMERTLEAMRLEAQIAKDMDVYQKRPKRRFVGARAEEYRFARYVEDWRLKIERVGNLNYPEAARQLKLYGNLILTVSIRADGTVETITVNRSSGQRVLDAAAVKIVEMSAPFAPFPPDIRRDTDILHVTRTWSFTKGDELRSE